MLPPPRSVLWHVHLMRPKHYLESCTSLLGTVDVIDHDPGYVSPKKAKGSSFPDKIELLYKRERQMKYGLSSALLSIEHTSAFEKESFVLEERSQEEWLAIAYAEDCYFDDMECG